MTPQWLQPPLRRQHEAGSARSATGLPSDQHDTWQLGGMHDYDISCFRRIPGVQLTRIYCSERILLRFARKTNKNFLGRTADLTSGTGRARQSP